MNKYRIELYGVDIDKRVFLDTYYAEAEAASQALEKVEDLRLSHVIDNGLLAPQYVVTEIEEFPQVDVL